MHHKPRVNGWLFAQACSYGNEDSLLIQKKILQLRWMENISIKRR